MAMEVAFVHNIIAPYRVPLFEQLASRDSVDLTVYYCSESHSSRDWKTSHSDEYDYRVLWGTTLEYDSYFVYHVNPGIAYHIFETRPDVVVIGGRSDLTMQIAFYTAKLLGIPVIIFSEATETVRTKLSNLIKPITSNMISNSDAIVVPGSASRQFFRNRGVSDGKLFRAPNAIDNDPFLDQTCAEARRAEIESTLGIEDEKVVLYLGRLKEHKGVEDLIRSFAKLEEEHEDAYLLICGDGPDKERFEALCEELQVENYHFTGWVDGDSKIAYYALADLFVHPSTADVWGLVLNEAMASGLPVISTTAAGGAIDLIVDGENGFVIEPNAPEQLYEAMEKLISDEEFLERAGEVSRQRIEEEFTIPEMADGFEAAIRHVERSDDSTSVP